MQAFQYFYTHVLKQTPKRKTAQDHFGYVSYFSKLKVHPKICLTINQEVFQMSLLLGLVEGSIPSVVNFFIKKTHSRLAKANMSILFYPEMKWNDSTGFNHTNFMHSKKPDDFTNITSTLLNSIFYQKFKTMNFTTRNKKNDVLCGSLGWIVQEKYKFRCTQGRMSNNIRHGEFSENLPTQTNLN